MRSSNGSVRAIVAAAGTIHTAHTRALSRFATPSPAWVPRAHVRLFHAARPLREQHDKRETDVDKPRPPFLTRMWQGLKHEAAHYWNGTKLLGKEVQISTRLLNRLIMGYSLTRREHRQLKRTTADLLRLIPFVPFVIIPMAEFLLPVAIKIFPNMLPSTFESKFAVEEKRRRLIKVRLEMAKFLQETIREGGLQVSPKVAHSDAFKVFFRKVRSTGESPSQEDVTRVAKLFDDDLTLDNLTRPQLVSMCRYMQVNAFGTDNFLRFQIRHELKRIRRDDIVIHAEGTKAMSHAELVSACQRRGIWTQNADTTHLRESLDLWIKLHFIEKISGTLLILSRAFYFVNYQPDQTSTPEDMQIKGLELTLASLPETLLNEAELNFTKEAASNKQRLEVIKEQEELIEDEAEQEEEELKARQAERARRSQDKGRLTQEADEAKTLLPKQDAKPVVQAAEEVQDDDARMTEEQLAELGEALTILSAKSSVLHERSELSDLMTHLPPETKDGGEHDESAPANIRALNKRINKMLRKLDNQLEEYDRDVGTRMHLIHTSSTGKISVDDLEQVLRLIKHRPEEAVVQKIVDKIDVDNDGLVPLADVLELAKKESGIGIIRDNDMKDIRETGRQIISDQKPRKSDIVE